MLLLVLSGFLLTAFTHHWLRGVILLACGPIAAGVFRIALKPDRVGLLAVRARWFDSVVYLSLGVLAVILGLLLPN